MRYFVLALFSIGILFSFSHLNDVHAADKAKEGEEAFQFVELSPLILPVINKQGVTQVISLVVALEVDSQEKADKVTKYQPRLTDAYLSDLYGAFSHKMPDSGIVPIAYLKERLNAMSTKVLGEHVVKDVLVQVMQNRPA